MDDETAPTLELLAVQAFADAEEKRSAARAFRRREEAQQAMRWLQEWSALPAEAVTDFPFKWQGLWFRPDSDTEGIAPAVEVYAWSNEDGWDWCPVCNLAEIGAHIAEWDDLTRADKLQAVITARNPQYLPDSARALQPVTPEA